MIAHIVKNTGPHSLSLPLDVPLSFNILLTDERKVMRQIRNAAALLVLSRIPWRLMGYLLMRD